MLGIRNKVYIIVFTIPHHDCSVLIDGVIYLQLEEVLMFLVARTGYNLYHTDNARDTKPVTRPLKISLNTRPI